jgi:hypothetical protein
MDEYQQRWVRVGLRGAEDGRCSVRPFQSWEGGRTFRRAVQQYAPLTPTMHHLKSPAAKITRAEHPFGLRRNVGCVGRAVSEDALECAAPFQDSTTGRDKTKGRVTEEVG